MDNAPLALGRGEGAVGNLNTVVNETTSRVGSWQPLLEKLQLFKDIVDKIAEVCYLAKYILSVLSHNGTFAFSGSPVCENGLEHPKCHSAGMCYGESLFRCPNGRSSRR